MMLEYDTLDYYNKKAQEYCNQTISVDFDFIYQAVIPLFLRFVRSLRRNRRRNRQRDRASYRDYFFS